MDLYPDVMEAHGAIRASGIVSRILQALTQFQLAGAKQVVSPGSFIARKVASTMSST